MKPPNYRDLFFLIPLAAACLVAFIRFPLLQIDDHLSVIRYIADEGRWPEVIRDRLGPGSPGLFQAQHPMLHHTIAAGLYYAVELIGASRRAADRTAQALSLFWTLGTAGLVWLILNRLDLKRSSRRMVLVALGTFTAWIWSAAAIGNDAAVGFWSTAALLAAIAVVSSPPPLAWKPVFFLCLGIGLAAASKDVAVVLLPGAVLAILARRVFYRESLKRLVVGSLAVLLVWGAVTSVNVLRHYRGTGKIIHYPNLEISEGLQISYKKYRNRARPKDFTTFQFAKLLRRPYLLKETECMVRDPREYMLGYDYLAHFDYQADSVWTQLYATWWSLPDHLPTKPSPGATRLLYLIALPFTFLGILGWALSFCKLGRPQYWPVVWWSLGASTLVLVLPFFSQIQWIGARRLIIATGSIAVFAALGFQAVISWKPALERWLWIYLFIQTAIFWYLLLAGPYYSFWPIWPNLTAL